MQEFQAARMNPMLRMQAFPYILRGVPQLFFMTTPLFLCLFLCLCLCLSLYLSVSICDVYPVTLHEQFLSLPLSLSACLSVWLPACLSA